MSDEITRLREENARLRKALEPFGRMGLLLDELCKHSEKHWTIRAYGKHMQAARKALETTHDR